MGKQTEKQTVTMYKVVGGKIDEPTFEYPIASDAHAQSVCQQAHKRMGLIGRWYCKTTSGYLFQVTYGN